MEAWGREEFEKKKNVQKIYAQQCKRLAVKFENMNNYQQLKDWQIQIKAGTSWLKKMIFSISWFYLNITNLKVYLVSPYLKF